MESFDTSLVTYRHSSSREPSKRLRERTPKSPRKRRSRSRGADAAIQELAKHIVEKKKVVIVTGAGLSVASGIRPFRSDPRQQDNRHVLQEGLWNDVIWSTATRASFRKDPSRWYNEFWKPHFEGTYQPNCGHHALQNLLSDFSNVRQITQNIDGLQPESPQIIEAHGRVGLYKCCPGSDSDTDSDDDNDRPIHLGHRRKSRIARRKSKDLETCPYQYLESLSSDQLVVTENQAPTCPVCGNYVMPQALLFDEGYHAHSFYDFERTEDWLADAEVLVFVGTSFAVQLTVFALQHARETNIPVYNFNLDVLESTARLNVSNVVGPAIETLLQLVSACHYLWEQQQQLRSNKG